MKRSRHQDYIQFIDGLMRSHWKMDEPGAAAVVARDGKVLFRKGYGLADREAGMPVEPDTLFPLASVTKQFTAVAVLMLVERGKVSLSDPLTHYLPGFPMHGHVISLEHLLTHSSGYPNSNNRPEWESVWGQHRSLGEILDSFKDKPLLFDPGTRSVYTNSGYLLLGAIIESATGQSYGEFLQKHVFGPLGMKHSFYEPSIRTGAGCATGYEQTDQGLSRAPAISLTQLHAAGGLMSTVDDLAIWNAALDEELLLKRRTLEFAFKRSRLRDGSEIEWGCGWVISDHEGRRLATIGGGLPGFVSYIVRDLEKGMFVAILSNCYSRENGIEALALKIVEGME